MRINWNHNPLLTVVELDEHDRQLLVLRTKVEMLEGRISEAHFDLDAEHGAWLKSIGKGRELSEAVEEAIRSLDYPYVCGDVDRNGQSFDVYVSERAKMYADELALGHSGDCTCVPCSCLKCHAENLVGIDTIAGLGKHEASYIGGAFGPKDSPRTLDAALVSLSDYEPKDVQEWGIPHVERWRGEAKRAHEWLIAYQREHFSTTQDR